MLSTIWTNFETGIVRYAFKGSGYFFKEGVNYSVETTSETSNE